MYKSLRTLIICLLFRSPILVKSSLDGLVHVVEATENLAIFVVRGRQLVTIGHVVLETSSRQP